MDVILSMFGPTAHGETPEQTAANLRQAGATDLLFFSSIYTSYRLLQPRYRQRAIYTPETDMVYWQPDLSIYDNSSVKPQRSHDFGDTDSLEAFSKALHNEGLKFNPLVPICAGQRLVQARPDLAVKNLYNSPDRLFMCYNNPDLRAYRFAMIKDIASRYDIDNLMLDKIPQTQLEQYSLSGIFDPPLRTVGSFCFCDHCKKLAAESSLDLDEIKQRCLDIANRSLDIPPHIVASQGTKLTGDTEIPLLLLEEPLIYKMLQFRFDTAIEFVAEMKAILKQYRPKANLQLAFVPPSHVGHDMTSPRAWLTAQSYKKYANVADEINAVIHYDPDTVRFETQRAVTAAEGKTRVMAGMRFHSTTRPEQVAALGDAAIAGGASSVQFLGYDIASDELLKALQTWTESKK